MIKRFEDAQVGVAEHDTMQTEHECEVFVLQLSIDHVLALLVRM